MSLRVKKSLTKYNQHKNEKDNIGKGKQLKLIPFGVVC